MRKKILEPTDQILCTIKILDDAIERLMQAVTILKLSTKYESDIEIFNLLKLIVRHTESVLALAREDFVLFPSAMVIARTAYEATIKLIWISHPDDPFDREIRWLAQLQTEEEYYSKMATRLDRLSKNTPVASAILALFIPLTVAWIFGVDIQKSTDTMQKITVAAMLTTDAFEKSKKARDKKIQINKMRKNHE